MKRLFLIALILFGCTSSQEPMTYEKLDGACHRLCKDLFKVETGTVSRVSNAGITCYCGY